MIVKLLPLLVLAFAFWLIATTKRRQLNWIRQRSRPLDDQLLLTRLNAFASALDVFRFEVRIFDQPEVNGLATPEGDLYISQGLYDLYRRGEVPAGAVAGAIAHEIGHVALNHHRRRAAAMRIAMIGAMAFFAMLLSRVTIGGLFLLAGLCVRVFDARMSQRDEFEADAFSAQLMMRAGQDPHDVLFLLEHLRAQTPELQAPFSWISTHPSNTRRIAHLREVIAAGV